jgi:hypothetical protein
VAYLLENEDETRLRLSAFVKLGAIVGIRFSSSRAARPRPALTFLPLPIVGSSSAASRAAGSRSSSQSRFSPGRLA